MDYCFWNRKTVLLPALFDIYFFTIRFENLYCFLGVDTIFQWGGGRLRQLHTEHINVLICLELWQLSIFNVANALEESTEHS